MPEADAHGLGEVTLEPHPHELESAITGEHVVVFGYDQHGVQFEVSGSTDADELNISWSKVELDADEVAAVLDGGVYEDRGEDLAGHGYTIEVRAGTRHPKGEPVWTRPDGVLAFCRVCGTDFEDVAAEHVDDVASQHILDRHRDRDPDEPIVITIDGGDDA